MGRSRDTYSWVAQRGLGIGSTDVKDSIKTLSGSGTFFRRTKVGPNPFSESQLSKLYEVPNLGVESLIINK